MRLTPIECRATSWLICAVLLWSMQLVHLASIQPNNKTLDERPDIGEYYALRKQFIDSEAQYGLGSDVRLNAKEQKANAIVMAAKEAEYANSISKPSTFHPSRHIFETLAAIKQTKLYEIIQKMPKGGILHAHDTAMCSADYVVSLTYWPHLWQLSRPNGTDVSKFLFSLRQPNTTADSDNELVWRRVNEVRHDMGAKTYDKYVRTLFTMYDESVQDPTIQFSDINAVWRKFVTRFLNVNKLLTYAPIWKAYFKTALKEMHADGVQYVEMRTTLPAVSFKVLQGLEL